MNSPKILRSIRVMPRPRFCAVVLCCLSFLAGANGAAVVERVFSIRGTVTEPLADDLITITHEAVPDYMPAMTMPFRVDPADRAPAAVLRVGDRVAFKFAVGDTSRAYDFVRLSGGAPPAPDTAAKPGRSQRIRTGEPVPPFSLVDQNGRPVTASDLQGRRTVITFIFTRCPVPEFCPRMSQQFQHLQQRLAERPRVGGAPVQLLSVSFDPEFDTPEVLRDYAERYDADPAIWRLCTGSADEVRTLTRAFAVHVEPHPGSLDHTLATALVGPDGRLQKIWRGNRWTADEVLAAIASQ
jgi:protein SCO1/2